MNFRGSNHILRIDIAKISLPCETAIVADLSTCLFFSQIIVELFDRWSQIRLSNALVYSRVHQGLNDWMMPRSCSCKTTTKSSPFHCRAYECLWAASAGMLCMVFAKTWCQASRWSNLSTGHCSRSLVDSRCSRLSSSNASGLFLDGGGVSRHPLKTNQTLLNLLIVVLGDGVIFCCTSSCWCFLLFMRFVLLCVFMVSMDA